jgi:hypothetical protein
MRVRKANQSRKNQESKESVRIKGETTTRKAEEGKQSNENRQLTRIMKRKGRGKAGKAHNWQGSIGMNRRKWSGQKKVAILL